MDVWKFFVSCGFLRWRIQEEYARRYLSRPSLMLKELAPLSTATEDEQVPKHSSIKTSLAADKTLEKSAWHVGLF